MSATRVLVLGAVALLALTGCSSAEKAPEPIFFPTAPDPPRIQLLRTMAGSDDLDKPSWFRKVVLGPKLQSEKLSVTKPYGSAFFDGKLYVCDSKGLVVVFDLGENEVRPLDREHPQYFAHPVSIAIAEDGTKYITDSDRRLVIVYDRDDHFATAFKGPEGWRPVGIAVAGDRVYVTDTKNHALHVFDRKTLKLSSTIGQSGSAPGEFCFPVSVAVDKEGIVYVTDSMNFRIEKFDKDGKLLGSFGSCGRNLGQFARPRGVALDRDGRIYVVDAAFSNVQIFDKKERLLLPFSALGDRKGDLMLPSGILISYDAVPAFESYVAPGRELEYVVFVASQYGPNRVSVFGFLKPLPNDADFIPSDNAPRTPLPLNPAGAGPNGGEVEIDKSWVPDSQRGALPGGEKPGPSAPPAGAEKPVNSNTDVGTQQPATGTPQQPPR